MGEYVTITPNDENRRNNNFTVDSIKFKKKLSDDTYASDFETDRPVNAGTYGVFVTTKDEKIGIEHAEALYIVDITIKNAKITNVSVKQISELTYNGTAQRADVTTTGTTVDGSPITFVYAETEDALETAPQSEVPEFQNAGTHTVYYQATASNHDAVTDSF